MNKLSGIVLHSIKYGESSLIAYVYTNQLGRQTYMLRGVRTPSARHKAALVQPLFLLDIEAYPTRKMGSMAKAKELKIAYPLQSLSFDIRKNAMALFIGEVLYKLVREEEQNENLYKFLHTHVLLLERLEEGVSNFHLYFLAHLAQHLGFFPGNEHDTFLPYFDMHQGMFVPFKPAHAMYMDKPTSTLLSELLCCLAIDLHGIKINRGQRDVLLHQLLEYYSLHLGMKNPIRSLSVLQEIFSS
ncbi:MAG: DNA repair protein RecO [Prevotellaceae bacterium]|nr:DNA repair protein RecO [Prevotellaceae bacterium]